MVSANIMPSYASEPSVKEKSNLDNISKQDNKQHKQKFNMCGYAAPELETVRIGFIGLGRGLTHVSMTSLLEGVVIKALCDIVPDKVGRAIKRLEGSSFTPETYTNDAEAWKKMCDRDDIDLVDIATPNNMHRPIALYAAQKKTLAGVRENRAEAVPTNALCEGKRVSRSKTSNVSWVKTTEARAKETFETRSPVSSSGKLPLKKRMTRGKKSKKAKLFCNKVRSLKALILLRSTQKLPEILVKNMEMTTKRQNVRL